MKLNPDDLLAALADVRVLLNFDVARLYRMRHDPTAFAAARHRLIRRHAGEYLSLIHQARALGADALTERRDALTARLERGWGIAGQRADDLFVDLLAQYEAICDALLPDATSPLLERVARIEAA